jgi:integrase/recombinase XerD
VFDLKGRRKYLNKSERRGYFRAAQKLKDRSERAFCLMLYYTGCRISEALNICPSSLDASEKNVVFETLKRRKQGVFRSVPLPNDFLRLLLALCRNLDASAKIWRFSRTTGYRLVKSRMRAARISGAMASPKGLRHGFAISCIQESIPLTVVKTWLGHARLQTTEIYLNVTGQEERVMAKRLWKQD